jgi:Carboxylesterase family
MADLRVLFLLVSIFCHAVVSDLSNCALLCKGCTKCVAPTKVKGKFGDYEAFVGIPYAAPPVGKLRFKVIR